MVANAFIDIAEVTPLNQYTATGGQTVFAYSFPIFSQEQLVVVETDIGASDETDFTRAAGAGLDDYVVAGVNSEAGGTITFNTGRTLGRRISIYRANNYKHVDNFSKGGAFTANAANLGFDNMQMQLQQIKLKVERAVRISESDAPANLNLPSKPARLGKYMRFNSTTGDVEAVDIPATSTQTIPAPSVGDAFKQLRINQAGNAYELGDKATGIASTSTTPQIVLVGDSLFKNHYASGTFEGLLTANAWNGQTPTLTNISVIGRAIRVMFEQAPYNLNPLYATKSGLNIAVLEGGHNDFNEGTSAPQAASYMIELSRYLRRLGWRTIITTMAAAQGKDAWREEVNGYWRKDWHLNFDEIADFGLDPDMGPLGAYSDLTYFYTDGNHYTLAGYTREASYVQAALDRLIIRHNQGILNMPGGDVTSLAVGYGALFNQNTDSKNNVAIGRDAMRTSLAASGNTVIGYEALYTSTDANNNAGLGYRVLRAATTGDSNAAVGHQAMLNLTIGHSNAGIGARALEALVDGIGNTGLGYHAAMATTSGDYNICIGHNAGAVTLATGDRNILIGKDADTPASGTSDYLNLNGVIKGDMLSHLAMLGGNTVLGKLIGANFNSTADQAIAITLPAGATRYAITNVWATNGSVNMTTAQGGLYSAAAKGGIVIVAATQAYTALTAAAKLQRAVVDAAGGQVNVLTGTTIYLSLTTAQGAAATADVFVLGVPLP